MQLLDRPPTRTHRPMTQGAAPDLLGDNHDAYQRLKLSLSLNLRRQVFLVVCDDLLLRDRLVAQLHKDLLASPMTRLVSLELDARHPNPIAQMSQWRAQSTDLDSLSGFQIFGIERLTRQPAYIQSEFLASLQALSRQPSALSSTLILWLTRPWFRTIQQSAPGFWRMHTALFEFEGDPTPIRAIAPPSIRPSAQDPHPWQILAQDLAKLDKVTVSDPAQPVKAPIAPASPAITSRTQELPTAQKEPQTAAIVDESLFVVETPETPIADDIDLTVETPEDAIADEPLLVIEPLEDAIAESVFPTTQLMAAPLVQISDQFAVWPQSPEALDLAKQARAILANFNGISASGLLLLNHLDQLYVQGCTRETLAQAYRELGNWFRDRIEQGDSREDLLKVTIRAYDQTVEWTAEGSPLWADALNDSGNLLWMLSRKPAQPEVMTAYLDQAIVAYQRALTHTLAADVPQRYAMIQNNLGSAYSDLARYRDPATSLQNAVQAYTEALRYRSPETDPLRYAATQNNLGTTYWNLAQHQSPVACLQRAIAAYQEALQYYSEAQEPLHYAMLQNNLGTAYWNLSQAGKGAGAPDELLQQAIVAYQAALVYRTLDHAPAAYAATQNNLGTAYWNLAGLPSTPIDRRFESLDQAITAYKSALFAVAQLTSSGAAATITFDCAATQNNLGMAYYQLATDKHGTLDTATRSAYLDAALSAHLQALKGWANQPEYYNAAFSYLVQTVRAFYTCLGMKGQQQALSKIPAKLLPELMPKL